MTKQPMNLYDQQLMSAPSVTTGTCVVCGKPASDNHHVVPRSRGGHKGPRLRLCGRGNTSGHHGLAHQHRLHFRYTDRWEYLITEPTKYERALEMVGWLFTR